MGCLLLTCWLANSTFASVLPKKSQEVVNNMHVMGIVACCETVPRQVPKERSSSLFWHESEAGMSQNSLLIILPALSTII